MGALRSTGPATSRRSLQTQEIAAKEPGQSGRHGAASVRKPDTRVQAGTRVRAKGQAAHPCTPIARAASMSRVESSNLQKGMFGQDSSPLSSLQQLPLHFFLYIVMRSVLAGLKPTNGNALSARHQRFFFRAFSSSVSVIVSILMGSSSPLTALGWAFRTCGS